MHLAAAREHHRRACEEAAEEVEVCLPELLTELRHVRVREVVHHAVKARQRHARRSIERRGDCPRRCRARLLITVQWRSSRRRHRRGHGRHGPCAVDEVVQLHLGRVHAELENDAPGAQVGQPRADLGRVLLEQLGLGVESARDDLAGEGE